VKLARRSTSKDSIVLGLPRRDEGRTLRGRCTLTRSAQRYPERLAIARSNQRRPTDPAPAAGTAAVLPATNFRGALSDDDGKDYFGVDIVRRVSGISGGNTLAAIESEVAVWRISLLVAKPFTVNVKVPVVFDVL